MPTQIKIDEVALLKEKLESAISIVLADYRGLTANEMVELREKFTQQGLEYRVVKDTLARLAADEAGIDGLAELFAGPISIAVGFEDPVLAFKLSEECRKTYAPRYELRGGVFEGVLVSESEVSKYVALPSREELLAKLAMLLSSPMRALAFMLQAKIRELAVLLREVATKRESEPAASAEEPAAEAAPAEETSADETPSGEASEEEAPAGEGSAEEAPADQGPADQEPAEDETPDEQPDEAPETQPEDGSQDAPEKQEEEQQEEEE